MNLKHLTLGALSALSLGLTAPAAHAYIFGSTQGAGATLELNGGADFGGPVLGLYPDPVTGWYSSDGFSDPLGWGYAYLANSATDPLLDGLARNNFFVFDLTDLPLDPFTQQTITITSATIRVFGHDVTQTDLFRLGRYTGDIDSLEAGTGGVTAFNALASGTEYATSIYYAGETSWRLIALNSDFLTDINNAIQNGDTRFVLGGTIGQLPIIVPEPASWALMIVGFLGTGMALRARRRAAQA